MICCCSDIISKIGRFETSKKTIKRVIFKITHKVNRVLGHMVKEDGA